jgi:hypothetical protein
MPTHRLKQFRRSVIWRYPKLYYPFGRLRRQGNVLSSNYEVYIEGYPRSGNTFCQRAFLLVNPGVHVRAHRHIPTFVVRSVQAKKPGMVLVRDPTEAAVSWAIFANVSLQEALAYYVAYYSTLLPFRQELFIVPFNELTRDFGVVMAAFNERWGTSYHTFDHTPANVSRCMLAIENAARDPDGRVREMHVSRPSDNRSSAKEALLKEIRQSKVTQDSFADARDLFRTFCD